jgi:glycosyltransferase involved in cell wall biosynthesis
MAREAKDETAPSASSPAKSAGEPRVLFFSQRYPPAFGGGSLYLKRIREGIERAGFESAVLAGDRGIAGGSGPGIYRLPCSRTQGAFQRLQFYLFALMAGPALVALRRRYDLIHTMGAGHFVYVGILIGKLLGKPIIVSSVQNRQDDPSGIMQDRLGTLKNAVFRRADRWVCCSGLQVETYRQAGYPRDRIIFIPSAVDVTRFSPCEDPGQRSGLRRSLGLPSSGPLFVSIGMIDARKGVDLLAEAWGRFRSRSERGTLVLVGPDRSGDAGCTLDQGFVDAVRETLRTAGVADSVIFTGQVDNVQDYLRAADAFVLMSRGEGFPNALLEAMATRLPFVIWDLPDYAGYDLQDGAHGFLVPRFDTAVLAERLARLAASDETRVTMGSRGGALAARFTVARAVADHIKLYRDVAARR